MKKAMLMVSVLIIGTLWVYAADAAPASPEQNASLMSNMTPADLETRGDILRAERNYPEAIRYYTEALRKNPKNSMLMNKIGITEMKRGNNVAADVNFQKAVKLDSKNADALNNIGVVAFFGKNFGKSVKFYKKALAIDETNATYHSNLGTAWFSQKKLERAMSEYARAMELDPEVFLKSNQGGSIARVSSIEDRGAYEYMLAKLYAGRGDWDRSFQWLAKAKEDGYKNLLDVYKDAEFAKVRQDPRLTQIVPPPTATGF